ncbi:MAG: succinylglutamate desuccinylase, partial [Aeromonas sp.]
MIPQHDFLALTRHHEWQLAPFEFSLPDGSLVSVWD